jgi:hypothetical protein
VKNSHAAGTADTAMVFLETGFVEVWTAVAAAAAAADVASADDE